MSCVFNKFDRVVFAGICYDFYSYECPGYRADGGRTQHKLRKGEKEMSKFKFSVGPWSVHAGADSYGPATRKEIDFDTKPAKLAEMGFSVIRFHDDDVVPDIND